MIPRILSGAVRTGSARPEPAPRPTPPRPAPRGVSLGAVTVAGVVLTGIILRFLTRSNLWMDEAITVSIARLPLEQIPEALRHDGAPPLYYLLLKGWLSLPGMVDNGARFLSGVFSVLALPLMAGAGRRLAGGETSRSSLLLLASSPFAIRYATEARMYSLLVLLALALGLLLCRVIEAGRSLDLFGLALTSAALLLTHYWALYALAVVAAWLAWRWVKGIARSNLALAAIAAGAILTAPWVPSAFFQLRHTGTPWALNMTTSLALGSVRDIAGSRGDAPAILQLMFVLLVFLGVFGLRRLSSVELRWPPSGLGRLAAGAWAGTLFLGGVAGLILGVGFAPRYISIVLPAALLSVVAGVETLPGHKLRAGVLAALVALGLIAALPNVWMERTSAGRVATVLNREADPGDVVAYCPDQLSPAVTRLLEVPLQEATFPVSPATDRVDWVNYSERVEAGDPEEFARSLLARAGNNDVWLVWAPGYRPFEGRCAAVRAELEEHRRATETVVPLRARIFERPSLVHSPAS